MNSNISTESQVLR